MFLGALLMYSCGQQKSKNAAMDYEISYVTEDKNQLLVQCPTLPPILNYSKIERWDSLEYMYNRPVDLPKFLNEQLDSMFYYKDESVEFRVANVTENYLFRRRYNYYLKASVLPPYKLANQIVVGDSVSQFMPILNGQKSLINGKIDTFYRSDYSKYNTILFEDWWGIYKHKYTIIRGRITSLKIDFEPVPMRN